MLFLLDQFYRRPVLTTGSFQLFCSHCSGVCVTWWGTLIWDFIWGGMFSKVYYFLCFTFIIFAWLSFIYSCFSNSTPKFIIENPLITNDGVRKTRYYPASIPAICNCHQPYVKEKSMLYLNVKHACMIIISARICIRNKLTHLHFFCIFRFASHQITSWAKTLVFQWKWKKW